MLIDVFVPKFTRMIPNTRLGKLIKWIICLVSTIETVEVSQDFSKWIVLTNDVEGFGEISWVEVENKKSNIKTIPT